MILFKWTDSRFFKQTRCNGLCQGPQALWRRACFFTILVSQMLDQILLKVFKK